MSNADSRAQRAPPPIRDRIVLRIVESGERPGFIIPHRDGGATFRGHGSADYACGNCGLLLAIGVRPGMFRSFVFACGCGGLNALD